MLNILKALTHHLLQMEQEQETSCAIPDENIADWHDQVVEELDALRKKPGHHRMRIEQLEEIRDHLEKVMELRRKKCAGGSDDA